VALIFINDGLSDEAPSDILNEFLNQGLGDVNLDLLPG
jgi:hypothetical protein